MDCLLFRLEHDAGRVDRNDLIRRLEKAGFSATESDGLKVCFSDGDYEKFDEICKSYASEVKSGIETFHMEDPGCGLMYEMMFTGERLSYIYPDLEQYDLPKTVKQYRKYFQNGNLRCQKYRTEKGEFSRIVRDPKLQLLTWSPKKSESKPRRSRRRSRR